MSAGDICDKLYALVFGKQDQAGYFNSLFLSISLAKVQSVVTQTRSATSTSSYDTVFLDTIYLLGSDILGKRGVRWILGDGTPEIMVGESDE